MEKTSEKFQALFLLAYIHKPEEVDRIHSKTGWNAFMNYDFDNALRFALLCIRFYTLREIFVRKYFNESFF